MNRYLKIYDEVNLEDLLNYGFVFKEEEQNYVFINEYEAVCTKINIQDRRIFHIGDTNANVALYDIIKAGLVEKVEEEPEEELEGEINNENN